MCPGGFLGDLLLTPAGDTTHIVLPKLAQFKDLPGIKISC